MKTIKITYDLEGLYYCPKCKTMYFTNVECSCPNLEVVAVAKSVMEGKL